jgi:hypothetical protein
VLYFDFLDMSSPWVKIELSIVLTKAYFIRAFISHIKGGLRELLERRKGWIRRLERRLLQEAELNARKRSWNFSAAAAEICWIVTAGFSFFSSILLVSLD